MPTKLFCQNAGHDGMNFANLLQDCFSCGIMAVDERGLILSLTPHVEKIIGLPAANMLHRSFEVLPLPLQAIIREAQTGHAINDRQILLQHSAGAPLLPVSVTTISISEKQSITVLLIKDFSAIKRLEENLERLDRLASIGTLSASMAHEIRNALVPAKTFLDLLIERNRDDELVGIVQKEMSRMDSIVGQMLKFAAPMKTAPGLVRLHEILEHSFRMVQHRIETKLITFNRSFQAAPDSLMGDYSQLEQAFVNLFLNAVEAINSNGVLSVATDLVADDSAAEPRSRATELREKSNSFLQITIADSGMGVPAENLDRIFEPFFTTKESGTGLGLPITRRIIEEHGGSIRIKSDTQTGTTFTILLPALANETK